MNETQVYRILRQIIFPIFLICKLHNGNNLLIALSRVLVSQLLMHCVLDAYLAAFEHVLRIALAESEGLEVALFRLGTHAVVFESCRFLADLIA